MTHKILIVDDSKLARMAVARALNNLYPQWSRCEAATADEALKCIGENAPDIVLLDFNMPGKDGLTLASELRHSHPKINVAVVSANQQAEVVTRTREAGATFLAKPLTEKALGEYLKSIVEPRSSAAQ